jgi:hypothetical protein
VTFVVGGGVVRQRSWCIARHVAALDACGVDAFTYVVGDSTDGTNDVLSGALAATTKPNLTVVRHDPTDAGWDRVEPRYSMANLAAARQVWVESVLYAFPHATHLWSCDSDIIPDDNVLQLLLGANWPVMVGANVALNSALTARNVMTAWNDGQPYRKAGDADLTLCDAPVGCTWTGACVLYGRSVFEPVDVGGCSFTDGDPTRMEEMGIVTRLRSLGISPLWQPLARTQHLQRNGEVWR